MLNLSSMFGGVFIDLLCGNFGWNWLLGELVGVSQFFLKQNDGIQIKDHKW